jgi:hypothetical protein
MTSPPSRMKMTSMERRSVLSGVSGGMGNQPSQKFTVEK